LISIYLLVHRKKCEASIGAPLFEGGEESYIYNNNKMCKNKCTEGSSLLHTVGLTYTPSPASPTSHLEPDFDSVKAEIGKLYDKEEEGA
jgi:hypothetical protein